MRLDYFKSRFFVCLLYYFDKQLFSYGVVWHESGGQIQNAHSMIEASICQMCNLASFEKQSTN